MRKLLLGLAGLAFLILNPLSVQAGPFSPPFPPGGFYKVETLTSANTGNYPEELIESAYSADNKLHSGLQVSSLMDFQTGAPGASFGVYSLVRGVGPPGNTGVHDIVGVHATAIKEHSFWAAALHADVYDSFPGGTAIGLNVEFPQTQVGTDTIGVNIQPYESTRGVIGVQLQDNATGNAYLYGIKAPNMNWVFGMVDDVPFGMRFNPNTQALELFRYIGDPVNETRVGILPMDFSQAK